MEKVCIKLSKWKWLLPQLSYRGRILVTNNLVAPTLWHKITVLQPPVGLIEEIQRQLVNFFGLDNTGFVLLFYIFRFKREVKG